MDVEHVGARLISGCLNVAVSTNGDDSKVVAIRDPISALYFLAKEKQEREAPAINHDFSAVSKEEMIPKSRRTSMVTLGTVIDDQQSEQTSSHVPTRCVSYLLPEEDDGLYCTAHHSKPATVFFNAHFNEQRQYAITTI